MAASGHSMCRSTRRPRRSSSEGAQGYFGIRRRGAVGSFGFRDAMMAAGGLRRAHAALVDPLLQRGVADPETVGGGAHGQKSHGDLGVMWRIHRSRSGETIRHE